MKLCQILCCPHVSQAEKAKPYACLNIDGADFFSPIRRRHFTDSLAWLERIQLKLTIVLSPPRAGVFESSIAVLTTSSRRAMAPCSKSTNALSAGARSMEAFGERLSNLCGGCDSHPSVSELLKCESCSVVSYFDGPVLRLDVSEGEDHLRRIGVVRVLDQLAKSHAPLVNELLAQLKKESGINGETHVARSRGQWTGSQAPLGL